jgi:nitrite reductase/ring-hydroxylating ferredoxin subunit
MRIKISEIKEGSITPIPGTDCLAVKTGSKIYVYRDQCPHAFCQFTAAGQLEGDVLICTCHWAKFDLKTGTSLVPELTTAPLTPAKYKIENDELVVEDCPT